MRTAMLLAVSMCSATYISSQAQSLFLDGAGDHMYVENDASLQLTDAVSIAAWVQLVPTAGTMCIARNGGTITPAYSLNRESSGHFVFWINNGSWQNSGTGAGPIPVGGQWYHVVGTYDGAAVNLFVNGVLEGSIAHSGSMLTTTDIFSVGSDVNPFGTYFNGWVDEVSVWNKALTAVQVQTVMADTLSSAYYAGLDSGLVAYWRFDVLEDLGVNGGGVDDVRDYSMNANHGDLVGDAALDPNSINSVIESGHADGPTGFFLAQNHPNPCATSTSIRYGLATSARVDLRLLDAHGRIVQRTVDAVRNAGIHELVLELDALAPGTYTLQLRAGPFYATRNVIVIGD